MTQKRIFFKGGAGKAGKHAIAYLLGQGHKVLMPLLVFLLRKKSSQPLCGVFHCDAQSHNIGNSKHQLQK
jgi:hypothetical protein